MRNPAPAPSHGRCPPSDSQLPATTPSEEKPDVFPPKVGQRPALRGSAQRKRRKVLGRLLSGALVRAGEGAAKSSTSGAWQWARGRADSRKGLLGRRAKRQEASLCGQSRGQGRNGRREDQGGGVPPAEGATHRKAARPAGAQPSSVPKSLTGGIQENSLPKLEGCLS